MIQAFVDRYMSSKDKIREGFRANWPGSYSDIVNAVVEAVKGEEYDTPSLDPVRITVIDDGDYQGTQLYIIGTTGYQPSTYYSVYVQYGSCSGCDSLQAIDPETDWDSDAYKKIITEENLDDVMMLALHIVQSLKEI